MVAKAITPRTKAIVAVDLAGIIAALPANKRITGWTIKGTSTAFNPATYRIETDMTIVATVEEKVVVTFGTDEYSFWPGEEVTAPATNPTKASDATNHYTFNCWEDSEHNAFAEGAKATADITYTAKFDAEAHSFGEWVTTTEAGCLTPGSKRKTCACGYYVDEEIYVFHHPDGIQEMQKSEGKLLSIDEKYTYGFFYDAPTRPGSSGSPIIIKDTMKVIGIHSATSQREGKEGQREGTFLGYVVDCIKQVDDPFIECKFYVKDCKDKVKVFNKEKFQGFTKEDTRIYIDGKRSTFQNEYDFKEYYYNENINFSIMLC